MALSASGAALAKAILGGGIIGVVDATKYPVGSHNVWEDSYKAECYSTFEELMAQADGMWLGSFAPLNWPVWIEYDAENEMEWDCGPTVTVGVFLPRHGECAQHIAPATPEQAHEMATVLMRVWALRADMHFRRFRPGGRRDGGREKV